MEILQSRLEELNNLEKAINYEFKNKNLLNLSLIHTSYANENTSTKWKNNQRLEFLGDAVLELVYTEILYKEFSIKDEGYLTKLRASLVCEEGFAELADCINLSKYLLLGKGEEKTNGRNKPSIKSDAFEALNGALYLDGGYLVVHKFIYEIIRERVQEIKAQKDEESVNNYKSMLQEHLHKAKNTNYKYELEKEEGPSHDKTFYMNVYHGRKLLGSGKGRNKKLAEQMAAKNALENLRLI